MTDTLSKLSLSLMIAILTPVASLVFATGDFVLGLTRGLSHGFGLISDIWRGS